MYQLGIVFQAGTPDGVTSDANAPGSLRGRHVLRDRLRQVLREQLGEDGRIDVGIRVALAPPLGTVGRRDGR